MNQVVPAFPMQPAENKRGFYAKLQEAVQVCKFISFVPLPPLNAMNIDALKGFKRRLPAVTQGDHIHLIPALNQGPGIAHDPIVTLIKRVHEHANLLAGWRHYPVWSC